MSTTFFTGNFASKPKVDLRGRSKEQDRKKLLEQARLDRERRQQERLEKRSATTIQAFFRGRSDVARLRRKLQVDWQGAYGVYGELADQNALQLRSSLLPHLLFFAKPSRADDVLQLASICRVVLQALSSSDPRAIFCSLQEYPQNAATVEHRVTRLSLLCLQALHYHRAAWAEVLQRPVMPAGAVVDTPKVLFETLLLLATSSPWASCVITNLGHKGLFAALRDLLLTVGGAPGVASDGSLVEQGALLLLRQHLTGGVSSTEGQGVQSGWRENGLPAQSRAATQFLSIPFLWQRFPTFRLAGVSEGIWHALVQSLLGTLPQLAQGLPPSLSRGLPSHACLLGNLLEPAPEVLGQRGTTRQQAADFASVAEQLLEALPPGAFQGPPHGQLQATDMDVDSETPAVQAPTLDPALQEQLNLVADSTLTTRMVHLILPPPKEHPSTSGTTPVAPPEASSTGAVCAFLHAANVLLPSPQRTRLFTALAFPAQLVPRLWSYIKRCHVARSWPPMELPGRQGDLGADTLGWMLPLAIFCPVYSYLLATTDDEEFYDQQKPLPLADVVQLVTILKEAVWHFLWLKGSSEEGLAGGRPSLLFASKLPAVTSPVPPVAAASPLSSTTLQKFASTGAARLLAQVHDWNSHRRFTPPETFHAQDVVDERFLSQVEDEKSRARELLQKAPFLVPFTDRVRVYQTLLSNTREQAAALRQPIGNARVTIRRDRIVEDGFDHLNRLGESLKGRVRIQFINEFGAEEAGVDGGGLFKDFIEGITKVAFDVQYGLFKETADHLLYPNPSSHLVFDEHLQYFEFLGRMLGKAMYEGILVDVPFATFFLSKLQQKSNHLNDLPSLDPELYRSLIFLKHYGGDVADLCLHFAVENNEYGEVQETELIPGGKDIPVTNENRIRYIHLVANHRMNVQIRKQSQAFQHGLWDLIDPAWIAFFNEQEMQMLISGSREGMDIEDLRQNVNYSGGYKEDHPVIRNFWEALRTFTKDEQTMFLKFVTGSSRGPLLGFKYLEPKFCIHRAAPDAAAAETINWLPTSATCMNLLKLPPYKSKEAFREKLLYAITSGAGFDLS